MKMNRALAIIAAIASLGALGLSAEIWISGDRLGIENRVSKLEQENSMNRDTLKRIQDDVKDIRQYLLGDRPKHRGG